VKVNPDALRSAGGGQVRRVLVAIVLAPLVALALWGMSAWLTRPEPTYLRTDAPSRVRFEVRVYLGGEPGELCDVASEPVLSNADLQGTSVLHLEDGAAVELWFLPDASERLAAWTGRLAEDGGRMDLCLDGVRLAAPWVRSPIRDRAVLDLGERGEDPDVLARALVGR
jgi:hypothetical protein